MNGEKVGESGYRRAWRSQEDREDPHLPIERRAALLMIIPKVTNLGESPAERAE